MELLTHSSPPFSLSIPESNEPTSTSEGPLRFAEDLRYTLDHSISSSSFRPVRPLDPTRRVWRNIRVVKGDRNPMLRSLLEQRVLFGHPASPTLKESFYLINVLRVFFVNKICPCSM